jgi:hypothetical protein
VNDEAQPLPAADADALPQPVPRRARRAAAALGAVALAPFLLVGSSDTILLGERPPTRPSTAPLPPAEPLQRLEAGADADGDGLDDALEAEVARRHAPRFRFAGRDPQAPAIAQNRDEEFFPMSVARFLAALEQTGPFRVRDGLVATEVPGRFAVDGRVLGYPWGLIGDPVGEAPLYTHVYPGAHAGEVFCEYWAWYGHDRADIRLLGVPRETGSHRGDWEHVAFRVQLDPPRLLEGYYYGHAKCVLVTAEQLERVEGEHPVVYVSQGKHASYPQACRIMSVPVPGWVVTHTDVANGLGPQWDTWQGALIDMGERDRPRALVERWSSFQGRWGPEGIEILGQEVAASPTGPTAKVSWGANGPGTPWLDHVAARAGVLLPR